MHALYGASCGLQKLSKVWKKNSTWPTFTVILLLYTPPSPSPFVGALLWHGLAYLSQKYFCWTTFYFFSVPKIETKWLFLRKHVFWLVLLIKFSGIRLEIKSPPCTQMQCLSFRHCSTACRQGERQIYARQLTSMFSALSARAWFSWGRLHMLRYYGT